MFYFILSRFVLFCFSSQERSSQREIEMEVVSEFAFGSRLSHHHTLYYLHSRHSIGLGTNE